MIINEFADLFNTNLKVEVNKTSIKDSSNVTFIESKDTKLKKVLIENLPDNTIAFSLDNAEIKNQLLNKSNRIGINKNCDGAIIVFEKSTLKLFLCELKSEYLHPSDYEYQLINSKEIFNYFLSLYNTFYNKKLKFTCKYILFYRERQKKGTIRPLNASMNNKHEKMQNFDEYINKISFARDNVYTCSYNLIN